MKRAKKAGVFTRNGMQLSTLAVTAVVLTAALSGAEPKETAARPAALADPAGEQARRKIQWVFSLMPKSMQRDPLLDMTLYTEMTDAGRQATPATPEHPVYYELYQGGYKFIGQGSENKHLPAPAELEAALKRSLATSGYHPAEEPGHPPTLLLIMHWGSHNRLDQEVIDIDPTAALRNLIDRAALVGGEQFARDLLDAYTASADAQNVTSIMPEFAAQFFNPVERFKEQSNTIRYLVEQADDDVYFVVASAYDYAAVADNRRVLLWRTKMTVNTQGVSMVQTLPPLIANASPYFGHETAEAVPLSKRGLPEGTVEVGTPTVVEVLDAPALPDPASSPTPPPSPGASRPSPPSRR